MSKKAVVIAMDLEGVMVPEIWIAVAEKTGIEKLRLTTRDISDYDILMKGRLEILRQNNLTLSDIQGVIETLNPLPGAKEYVEWAKQNFQLIILSDTFYEFSAPLMKKLNNPTIFCHFLQTDEKNFITDYKLRQTDAKRKAVIALRNLDFFVISIGDSYNDTTMLGEADAGILFRPPQNVIDEFPQYPVVTRYDQLKKTITDILAEKNI